MNDLNIYTPTELLKFLNDVKFEHDKIKNQIIGFTEEVDELDKKINNNLLILEELEKKYIELIEEINNR